MGAGAIWDPSSLVEGLVTTSRRTAVGIASISAALGTLAAGNARLIRFGGVNPTVRAVFGPGLIMRVGVAGYVDLPMGEIVGLDASAGLVALDGERRLPADRATARVVPGPRVIDLARAFSRV